MAITASYKGIPMRPADMWPMAPAVGIDLALCVVGFVVRLAAPAAVYHYLRRNKHGKGISLLGAVATFYAMPPFEIKIGDGDGPGTGFPPRPWQWLAERAIEKKACEQMVTLPPPPPQ